MASVFRRPVSRKISIGKARRVFSFKTHQADIFLTRVVGKARIVRIDRNCSSERDAKETFVKHRIFHLLFPKNSVKPLGIAGMGTDRKKAWGMVSEIIKGRVKEYKAYQKAFYKQASKCSAADKQALSRYSAMLEKQNPVINSIAKAGIALDPTPVNACILSGGNTVFFEIWGINTGSARAFVQKHVQSKRKKQALFTLLDELEKLKRGN